MANPSIQLGTNSNWAVKEDKLLAYKEYNDYFFNKEFDFSRGTSATYVAKDGLIKTAGIQPNIVTNGDFSDGTNDWEAEGNSSITVGTYEGRSNVANINILNTSVGSRIRQPFNYVNGKKYKVTVNVFLVSGSFRIDSSDSFVSGDFVSTSTTGSWLTLSAEIDAISTGSNYIWLRSLSEVSQFYVDNISVQEIQTDTPRIDFTNDTKGHLLLEPQRTNLITYSEDFSQSSWVKLGAGTGTTAIVTSDYAISPDGTQNASRLQCDLNGGGNSFSNQSLIYNLYSSSGSQALSIYMKSNNGENQTIYFANTQTSGDTVTVTSEWQRFTFTHSTSLYVLAVGLRGRSGGAINDTADILIWGAQAEAGSYATSYIPTVGAASTRNADVCNNSGSAQDFNDSEGVLYAEIAALESTSSGSKFISISDGTYNNRASILFSNGATNQIRCFLRVGGVSQVDKFSNVSNVKEFNKVAFSYKENEFKVFINGSQAGSTDTSGSVWSSGTITKLSLTEINSALGAFNGKVRNVQVFTEALIDSELQELTS